MCDISTRVPKSYKFFFEERETDQVVFEGTTFFGPHVSKEHEVVRNNEEYV